MLRKLLLALALMVPSTVVATAPPAAAHHDTYLECYGVDIGTYSTIDWIDATSGWETVYYDHYYECTDGHWWWWEYQFSWSTWHYYYST